MNFVYYNPNPRGKLVGDCSIRAISKIIFDGDWSKAFIDLMTVAYDLCDMPSSNYVIDQYLKSKGFRHRMLPDTCPDCYTLQQFVQEHPNDKYIVATGSHLIAVDSGVIYDSWDSRDEIVTYYYAKEEL